MAGRPPNKLNDRHWAALKEFASGRVTVTDVAKRVGFDYNHLLDLTNGNVERAGLIAKLFQREYDKIYKNIDKSFLELLKRNKELAMKISGNVLDNIHKKAKPSDTDKRVTIAITKALASIQPQGPKVQNISTSYSYTKGLNAQELVYEFNRLKGLAEGPSNGKGIPEAGPGRPGALPAPLERGSEVPEIPEDPGL